MTDDTVKWLSGAEMNARRQAELRILLLAFRQALIIMIGAIEDFLELPRSIIPKHRLT